MRKRIYEIILEGLENNKEFFEVLYSSPNRNEILHQYEIEKNKLESDPNFFLHKFVEDCEEWELDSQIDIPMPITRYEAHSKLNYAELYVSIDFGDDERDLSLERYKTTDTNTQNEMPLNFNYGASENEETN